MLLAVLIVRLVGLWLFFAHAATLLQLQRLKSYTGGMAVSRSVPGEVIYVAVGGTVLGLAIVVFAVPVVRLLTFDVKSSER